VAALGGEPGVRSGRYAGEQASYAENVAKLLAELERVGAVAAGARRARFRTVAMVCAPSGPDVEAVGVVAGTVASEPRGAGGFGYDSVFVPDRPDGSPGDRTFAEMSAAEKHAISHRGRAFRALAALLT
jgi:XTP/dITP diphosphohydrolase